MFQCLYIYPALHSNSYCCEVLINKIRNVKYPIMTQLKKKNRNTLHSRPCLLSWQTAANRPIKAGMVCFGPWQDTKTPGSDKGGCELYCENPCCQDILHASRWREKKNIHTPSTAQGRYASVSPSTMFTINNPPVSTSRASVTHKAENIVYR